MVDQTFVPPSPCPSCGRTTDCATGAPDTWPKPRDVTVCFYCGGVMQFGPDLKLVTVDPDDYRRMPGWLREKIELMSSNVRRERN